eukprot:TRINITY_DN7898_c0_g1_i7.p4 TRINITY_DN7898_c0_g1~~TRINITY_DN7898_c0_g1_i7.p4  ORF type:complete len:143 (-),score=8.56 TRINITY_DN7898_c0_g1_i7:156-584(-)
MYCENLVGKVSEYKNISWMQVSNSGKPLVIRMHFYKGSVVNNYSVGLNSEQRQEITCLIAQEGKIAKSRVFSSEGICCSEYESNNSVSGNSTTMNSTRRVLSTSDCPEYFLIMTDLYAENGSLSNENKTILSEDFKLSLIHI